MRIKDSWIIQIIIKYIKGLITIYIIGYVFLFTFLVVGYFFKLIYKTVDFIIFYTTGIKSLRPDLEKRTIKFEMIDGFMISLSIIMGLWYYYIERPQKIKNDAKDIADHRRIDSLDKLNHSDNSITYSAVVGTSNLKTVHSIDTSSIIPTSSVVVQSENLKSYQDSIELMKQDWKNGNDGKFIISNKLPLTYSYGSEKYTFKKENDSLKVDCYNSTGLYGTFSCNQKDNKLIMNADGFFSLNEGNLYLVSTVKHYSIQLAFVRN